MYDRAFDAKFGFENSSSQSYDASNRRSLHGRAKPKIPSNTPPCRTICPDVDRASAILHREPGRGNRALRGAAWHGDCENVRRLREAQTGTQPSHTVSQSRIELELGSVTVWLGMPEASALQEFESASYRVRKNPPSGASGYCFVLIGSTEDAVFFREGRLAFAERDWNSGKTAIASVVGALVSLMNHGAQSCGFTHYPMPFKFGAPQSLRKPGVEGSDWVVIDCDHRSVRLMEGMDKMNGKTFPVTDIHERIGS